MKNILMRQKRFESGELYEKDSIKVADSLKSKHRRKIVHGGGGIVPDILFLQK
jgi:carboxyl-terminal processing protease